MSLNIFNKIFGLVYLIVVYQSAYMLYLAFTGPDNADIVESIIVLLVILLYWVFFQVVLLLLLLLSKMWSQSKLILILSFIGIILNISTLLFFTFSSIAENIQGTIILLIPSIVSLIVIKKGFSSLK